MSQRSGHYRTLTDLCHPDTSDASRLAVPAQCQSAAKRVASLWQRHRPNDRQQYDVAVVSDMAAAAAAAEPLFLSWSLSEGYALATIRLSVLEHRDGIDAALLRIGKHIVKSGFVPMRMSAKWIAEAVGDSDLGAAGGVLLASGNWWQGAVVPMPTEIAEAQHNTPLE